MRQHTHTLSYQSVAISTWSNFCAFELRRPPIILPAYVSRAIGRMKAAAMLHDAFNTRYTKRPKRNCWKDLECAECMVLCETSDVLSQKMSNILKIHHELHTFCVAFRCIPTPGPCCCK